MIYFTNAVNAISAGMSDRWHRRDTTMKAWAVLFFILIGSIADSNAGLLCAPQNANEAKGAALDVNSTGPFPHILKQLSDSNSEVRANAASHLGDLRDPRSVQPLISCLSDSSPEVRRDAANSLGKIRNPVAAGPLIDKLTDNDSRVRTAAAAALGELRDKRIAEALIAHLSDSDGTVRAAIAYSLGQLLDPRAIQSLGALLDDSNSLVRQSTASALERLKDPSAVLPLMGHLGDSDPFVRFAIAEALGAIKDRRATELLIARLKDSNRRVQMSTAYALGSIGDSRAVQPLIASLTSSDAFVRAAAASALGSMKDIRAIEPLSLRLKDSDSSVSESAALSLAGIKDPRAIRALTECVTQCNAAAGNYAKSLLDSLQNDVAEEPVPSNPVSSDSVHLSLIVSQLDDPSPAIRQWAAHSLSLLREPVAVEPLISRLSDSDKHVRASAAYALGEIRDTRSVEPLIAHQTDPDANVRGSVILALGEIRDPRAIVPLIASLKDQDATARKVAAYELGGFEDPRAVEPLTACLKDSDADVRNDSEEALKKLKPNSPDATTATHSIPETTRPTDDNSLEAVLARLSDPDPVVRINAVQALFNTKDYRAVLPLITCLSDPDPNVREAAVGALAATGDPRSTEPLIFRLSDSDESVRQQVMFYLGLSEPETLAAVTPHAFQFLIRHSTDEDVKVRVLVISLLEKIKDPDSLSIIVARLADREPEVRTEAAEALVGFRSFQVIDPLIPLLVDVDEGVKHAAVNTLAEVKHPRVSELQRLQQLIRALSDPDVQDAVVTTLTKMADPRSVEPLIKQLSSSNASTSRATAMALRGIKDPRTVEPLIAHLHDVDKVVVAQALSGLWLAKDPRAINPVAALLYDPEVGIQAEAILGEFGDARAIDPAIDRLSDPNDPSWDFLRQVPRADSTPRLIEHLTSNANYRRGAGAEASGLLFEPRTVDALVALLTDPDPSLRLRAVTALSRIKDPRAVQPLIARLADTDVRVRIASCHAFFAIPDRRAVEPLMMQLSASDPNLRLAAVVALGEIKDARSVEHLIALLSDKEPRVRWAAAEGLGKIQDPLAVAPLLERLSDIDPHVKMSAAYALGRIKDPRTVEPLIARFGDPNEDVRRVSANAVIEITDTRTPELLIQSLAAPNAKIRRYAAWSLMKIKDRRAVEPLIRLASDPDKDVRQIAAMALGEIGDPKAFDSLILRLSDHDPDTKAQAAKALGKIKDPRAIDPIIALLKESNYLVQAGACEALGWLADPRAIKPLTAVFSDENEYFRQDAVEALGAIKDPEATNSLIQALSDPNPGVRSKAIEMLAKVNDHRVVPPIIQHLTDSDESVRLAAAVALGEIGDQSAANALFVSIGDDNEDVQRASAFSLATLDDSRAMTPALAWLTSDRAAADRGIIAITKLGKLNEPATINVMQRLPRLDLTPLALTALDSADHYQCGLLALVHIAAVDASYVQQLRLLGEIGNWDENRGNVESSRLAADLNATKNRFGVEVETDPFLDLFVARLHFANERFSDALQWSEKGLSDAAPDDTALRMWLTFVQVQSLEFKEEHRKALNEALNLVQELLPKLANELEVDFNFPVVGYALELKGIELTNVGESEAAERVLRQAESAVLESQEKGFLDRGITARILSQIQGFQSKALKEGSSKQAAKAAAYYDEHPPIGRLDKESNRIVLISQIQNAIESEKDYDKAQQLTEKLALLSLPRATSVTLGDPVRNGTYRHMEELNRKVQDLDRELQQADSKNRNGEDSGKGSTARGSDVGPNGKGGNANTIAALQIERARAWSQYKSFLQTLKLGDKYLAARFSTDPLEVKVLQSRLETDQRLVQYLLLENRAFAFIIEPTTIIAVPLSVELRQVEAATLTFRRLLAAGVERPRGVKVKQVVPRQDAAAKLEQTGQQLSKWLVEPLLPYLEGVTSLVIVPNGPLYQLPFSALPLSGSYRGQYLVQRFVLRVLNASSMMAAVAYPTSGAEGHFIAFADPASPGWPALAGADQEVDDLKSGPFPDAEIHKGADARRTWLVGRPLQGTTLHLAVHAEAGAIDRTQVILSDGVLSLGDVQGLALDDSPLVVLSACETAIGPELSGGEVASLSEAFINAGSHAVVASLWPINDQGTYSFMKLFYAKRELGYAAALAAAQRQLIDQRTSPALWAAFTITGW